MAAVVWTRLITLWIIIGFHEVSKKRWILDVSLWNSESSRITKLLLPIRGRLAFAQAGTVNPSDPWDSSEAGLLLPIAT